MSSARSGERSSAERKAEGDVTLADLVTKLDELRQLPGETEWVEFKHNNANPREIGENISALANGAALQGKRTGYLVSGVKDDTHTVVGTTFRPRQTKKGNENLENWSFHQLSPGVDFTINEFERDGTPVVLFAIQAASGTPVRFEGEAYTRVGSYTKRLKDVPAKERRLWAILSKLPEDWSGRVVEGATIADLDPDALNFARTQYREKHPSLVAQVDTWDDATLLNKARVLLGGKVTHAALVLLGRPESAHLLSPAQARITWVLQEDKGQKKDL